MKHVGTVLVALAIIAALFSEAKGYSNEYKDSIRPDASVSVNAQSTK